MGRLTVHVGRATRRVLSWRGVWCDLLIASGLGLSWLVSYVAGGANVVPPHAFYFPILLAAVRFGATGATLTAIASSVIAGPLLPARVDAGDSQPLSDWLVRSGFFITLGLCIALLVAAVVSVQRAELHRRSRELQIEQALERDEFFLLYQPVVRFDGEIVGVEALLRWNLPDGGVMTPDHFIPLAEEGDLIVPIGRWVLETACAQAAEWRSGADTNADMSFGVAVNVSPRELRHPGFVEHVTETLARTGLPADCLVLELTETAFVEDMDWSILQLESLKRCGVSIAVDDFGVGYGSLTYVHSFPIDVLKIDRSFVAALPASRDLVDGIITLARRLGLLVVAEGVETGEQAAELSSLDADLAQGWLYSQAVPAHVITERVRMRQRDAELSNA